MLKWHSAKKHKCQIRSTRILRRVTLLAKIVPSAIRSISRQAEPLSDSRSFVVLANSFMACHKSIVTTTSTRSSCFYPGNRSGSLIARIRASPSEPAIVHRNKGHRRHSFYSCMRQLLTTVIGSVPKSMGIQSIVSPVHDRFSRFNFR